MRRAHGGPFRLPAMGATATTLAAVLICVGCRTPSPRGEMPAWISNPNALDAIYPRSRYLIGFGVCGGAGPRDVMSRKQAENSALSDLASYVQVAINDVIEQHDTEVVRDGRSLVQNVTHQATRREVTGLLSGAQVREVYFDPRSLTWHAYAVLERAAAGRGALEALAQRKAQIREALNGLGSGPLADWMRLRSAQPVLEEMERLVTAVSVFMPSGRGTAEAEFAPLAAEVRARLAEVEGQAAVRLTVEGAGPEAAALREGLARVLSEFGLRAAETPGPRELRVAVMEKRSVEAGTVRLCKVSTGADYRLVEGERVLLRGECPADESTVSRAETCETALRKSLEKLRARLPASLRQTIRGSLGLESETRGVSMRSGKDVKP